MEDAIDEAGRQEARAAAEDLEGQISAGTGNIESRGSLGSPCRTD